MTEDIPYFCDAPKMLLLVLSLIQCKHLKGQTPGTFRWGNQKFFLHFFFLFSQGIKFWQTSLSWWTKIMQMELLIHVCPCFRWDMSSRLGRIGATWGQELCWKVSFRPVGSKKDLSTQASSVQGRAKPMELPPQNISEGIKPNKLIYGTCLAACGRVLATALTPYSIYSQAAEANGVCWI